MKNGPGDEVGEKEDWIELYNKSASTVNLSGYYITDNVSNIKKWQLPEGTLLPANKYLILWCDEDQEQGSFHTNFKLSASGETILLSDAAGALG